MIHFVTYHPTASALVSQALLIDIIVTYISEFILHKQMPTPSRLRGSGALLETLYSALNYQLMLTSESCLMQGGLLVGSRKLPFCSYARSQSPGLQRQSLNPPPPPVKRHSAPANATSPSETQWNNTTQARASSSVEGLQAEFQTLEFIPSASSPDLASATGDTDGELFALQLYPVAQVLQQIYTSALSLP